jgi:hypothetical protein
MPAEVWVWPESVKEDAKNSRIRVEATVAARISTTWALSGARPRDMAHCQSMDGSCTSKIPAIRTSAENLRR